VLPAARVQALGNLSDRQRRFLAEVRCQASFDGSPLGRSLRSSTSSGVLHHKYDLLSVVWLNFALSFVDSRLC